MKKQAKIKACPHGEEESDVRRDPSVAEMGREF